MKIKVYRHRSPPSLTHSLLKAEPQTHKHACTEAGLTAWPSRCCQEIWNSITASPHSFSDADGGEQTLKMYKGQILTCVALPRIQIKHNTHKKKFLVELKQQNRDKKRLQASSPSIPELSVNQVIAEQRTRTKKWTLRWQF